jgi:hypothetical protein
MLTVYEVALTIVTDHVSGLRDVPASAIVYTGPGESSEKGPLNVLVRGVTDAALEGKGPTQEWAFPHEEGAAFDGVVDVFGDGTFWAIHVPGHTAGSTSPGGSRRTSRRARGASRASSRSPRGTRRWTCASGIRCCQKRTRRRRAPGSRAPRRVGGGGTNR